MEGLFIHGVCENGRLMEGNGTLATYAPWFMWYPEQGVQVQMDSVVSNSKISPTVSKLWYFIAPFISS